MSSLQKKNQHLMWRAGFGPAATQIEQLKTLPVKDLYQSLKTTSSGKFNSLDVADEYLKDLVMGMEGRGKIQKRKEAGADEKKKIREQNRDDIKNLNLAWLNEMVQSEAQLREKLSLFWHGHFASRNINIFYQQQLLDIIRQNATGSFRKLLHEVSTSAAILTFLNAQQNKKDQPNENFAREVMELFTMGRGNYTETDVKEAARAFTGWSSNVRGEFIFRRFQHDTGRKTVLGKSGNFKGEDVIDILLEQKQTAVFITQKIYRFFVNDTPDHEKIYWLAERFYSSDYNISSLMDDIFTSSWFYDEKNIGTRIKSPVELLAGIQRILPMKIENPETLLLLQRVLGQMLFYPPNVAGWPGGKSWIDSSTLMARLRIPQLLNDKDDLAISPKTDDDQMMGMAAIAKKQMGRTGRPIQATIHWEAYIKNFEKMASGTLTPAIKETLLQGKVKTPDDVLKAFSDGSEMKRFVQTLTLQVMSLPEYQMC
jgi:uncharacterized protein (DUF1800 family)